jgi:hypothetical protein
MSQLERHRAQCHAFFKGKHYLGDYKLGIVYDSAIHLYTDNNLPIMRLRQSPHVSAQLYKMFYKMFELDLQFGVGDIADPAQNNPTNNPVTPPLVSLEISNDGGKTWSASLQASLGTSGQYLARARWHRLGAARDRVFRVIITAPVQCAMLGAYLDVEKGTN